MNPVFLSINPGVIALTIPIVAIVSFATLAVFLRSYAYRERMAMIERGLTPSDVKHYFKFGERDPHNSLRLACTAIGVGVGLFLGNFLRSFESLDKGGTVAGLICICGGLGLLIGYFIQYGLNKAEKKTEKGEDSEKI